MQKHSYTAILCLLITAIFIVSCSPSKENLQVEFRPYYKNKPVDCKLSFEHGGKRWSISTLGMFVSSINISTERGNDQNAMLIDSNWQTAQTALLWFTPRCQHNEKIEPSNNQFNRHILMQVDSGSTSQAKQLGFTLAVPFTENHANPLTQPAPLNNPEMFWAWQTGHKFMRFDINQINGSANWAFHLGSLGCSSKSTLRAPNRECAQPNRVKMLVDIPERPSTNPKVLVIKLNIDTLLHNVDVANTPPCMFNLNKQDSCMRVVQNLSTKPVFTAAWQVRGR